jgi:uncharacterized protein (TIGR03032 family)
MSAPEAETIVPIRCGITDGFQTWMSRAGGALAVTTYHSGKVILFGWDGRQVTLQTRHFEKPMGLAVDGQRVALATRSHIWLFANAPLLAAEYEPERPGQFDALYLPRARYYTGDVAVHDIAFGRDGLWLVATRFSCLALLSYEYSFVPRWQPSFITGLAAQDRCHMNGLALVDGWPRYVTALGETDTQGGWRANKATGGIVIDVESGATVLRGLAMPHSPRWHEGRLWVLNSGAGELWQVDPRDGRHTVVCALPGYLRGLCLLGPYAVIGLSEIRERHTFAGLPVQERHKELKCAVVVVDLRTGQQVGAVDFVAGCHELYDIQFLPGVHRPMILDTEKEGDRQAITTPQFASWIQAGSLKPAESGADRGPPA